MITLKAPSSCPPEVVLGYFERATRWETEPTDEVSVSIYPDAGFGSPDWIANIIANGKSAITIGAHAPDPKVIEGKWYFHS